MNFSGIPADPEVFKPLYIIMVEDPTAEDSVRYLMAKTKVENGFSVEFRGFRLTKKQAETITKKPDAEIRGAKAVNQIIPWHRIISIENVTYQVKKQ